MVRPYPANGYGVTKLSAGPGEKGFLHRAALIEFGEPGLQLGAAGAPLMIIDPEIRIAEPGGDGNLADIQGAVQPVDIVV